MDSIDLTLEERAFLKIFENLSSESQKKLAPIMLTAAGYIPEKDRHGQTNPNAHYMHESADTSILHRDDIAILNNLFKFFGKYTTRASYYQEDMEVMLRRGDSELMAFNGKIGFIDDNDYDEEIPITAEVIVATINKSKDVVFTSPLVETDGLPGGFCLSGLFHSNPTKKEIETLRSALSKWLYYDDTIDITDEMEADLDNIWNIK